ncbi:ABC transporter ATP-binding protein [Moheibacter lacus]|uniref:ATP-binding cassette domain-containing protein n=1 Tax=Moheibacter lacus TaxID=2745851 RepID=A0A838ZN32_9FLAO|nr:ATP-binding cassette domain-containing protein [Moheibacter lacus]MBA5629046.1 ATP-binding cassette domain-containing protein [Moheibacter lacus]
MIEVKNLKKQFEDIEVLKGISTVFETGKTNLIIGQSGSGKTVFLKCLTGLITPTSGEILFDGRDTTKFSYEERQALRGEIGTVFQGSALFDSMTVLENVRFPLEMFSNLNMKEMNDRSEEVLTRVNLTPESFKKFPSEISGGMQKRVAIARAIVNKPKYLFADEPNSGLDPKTSMVIDQLLHELTVEYNTTTIINTHDMNSVMEIGETIIFLKNGILEWSGDKNEILTADNEAVIDFVYSSKLFTKLREVLLEEKANLKK